MQAIHIKAPIYVVHLVHEATSTKLQYHHIFQKLITTAIIMLPSLPVYISGLSLIGYF